MKRLRSRFRSSEVPDVDERDELDGRSPSLKFLIPVEIDSSANTIGTVDSSASSSKLPSEGENGDHSCTKSHGTIFAPSSKFKAGKETGDHNLNAITAIESDPTSCTYDGESSTLHEVDISKEGNIRPLRPTMNSSSSLPLHVDMQGAPPRPVGKRVHFSTITIQEYLIQAGDNPATTRGVPVTITWDHHREYTVDLEDYERLHPARRANYEMKMESLHRFRLLKSVGYSREELQNLIDQVNLDRRRRQRTIELMRFALLEEFFERACRVALNATFRRNKKRQERAELDPYRLREVDSRPHFQLGRGRRRRKYGVVSQSKFHTSGS